MVLEGEPRVLIRDGELMRAVLARDCLSDDEVLSEMRLAGIARLEDVAWGILEPNGKISFLKKGD